MILSVAERQLVKILRGAPGHQIAITVRVSDDETRVDVTYGSGHAGYGIGESFEEAWHNLEAR
jgi:hypothetical protein